MGFGVAFPAEVLEFFLHLDVLLGPVVWRYLAQLLTEVLNFMSLGFVLLLDASHIVVGRLNLGLLIK